ncbi:MAG TPA: hypothetical protein VFM09_06610 [Marmoricola sp.]|nr:hypothetical protein [Marmoricola sp.]
MTGVFRRGLVAGAVGTTVIEAVTWIDMAVRGRASSDMPQRTVRAGLDALGVDVPGSRSEREHRTQAFGALSGIGAGVGVGLAASSARALGIRLPGPLGATATGLGAMALTDLSAQALGTTDLRSWSTADWASDLVPHLAYGSATTSVLRGMEKRDPKVEATRERPTLGLLCRSLMLGLAAGGRSSLGVAAPTLSSRRTGGLGKAMAALAVAGELGVDKSPVVPSRLDPPALQVRVGSGALGAAALASRQGAATGLAMLAGAVGAVAGSLAGATWREATGLPGWQAGLVEDGAAVGLAALACRG